MNEISLAPDHFCWATGIEDTFIPQTRDGLRKLDEYELTQHYDLWQSDFDLLEEAGVQAVRWGIPWYRVQPEPDVWDWSWTDRALDYLVNVKRIQPILDIMHYGTPFWLTNSFLNAGYPERVAEYSAAVVERYRPLVRYITPLNEPTVNAEWSGFRGRWPPYLEGDDGFVKLLIAIGRGIILATRAMKAVHPELVTVQVEALWRFVAQEASIEAEVSEMNARQYLSFDLVTGRVGDDHPLYGFLRRHGVSGAELEWFRQNAVSFDILGANFYPWSYGEVSKRKHGLYNRISLDVSGLAIAEVLSDAYARYGIPLMVTETSARRDIEGRARWMDETISAVRNLRSTGVPIVGYTWFPFFTMFSWYYRRGRRPLDHYILHLGLYDAAYDEEGVFRRHRTPLVDLYRSHMARPMPVVPEPSPVAKTG